MAGLARIYKIMQAVECTDELAVFSFLHYERLRHVGLSSVRILNGRVERLLFRESAEGVEITLIEINENHYGDKR